MKYRVVVSDGTIKDFDTEPEAYALYNQKKAISLRDRVMGAEKLTGNIHRCYHGEGKPCEIIERFSK